MSDPAPRHQGIIAQVVGAASAAVGSLPPGFLGLLFVNLIFLVSVVWLVDRVSLRRADFTDRLLTACLQSMEKH